MFIHSKGWCEMKSILIRVMFAISILSYSHFTFAEQIDKNYITVEEINEVVRKKDILQGVPFTFSGVLYDVDDIVVKVTGEIIGYECRKKHKLFGLWIDRDKLTIPFTHSFLDIISNKAITEITIKNYIDRLELDPDNPNIIFAEDHASDTVQGFITAYAEHCKSISHNRFTMREIELKDNGIFYGKFVLPKNTIPGRYTISFYCFKDKIPYGRIDRYFIVEDDNIRSRVHSLSHTHPMIYSMLIIIMAMGIALFAYFIFTLIDKISLKK